MADLRRKVLAEVELVEATLDGLREAVARPKWARVELAAAATFVHNAYNGMENILKQTLGTHRGRQPDLALSVRAVREWRRCGVREGPRFLALPVW